MGLPNTPYVKVGTWHSEMHHLERHYLRKRQLAARLFNHFVRVKDVKFRQKRDFRNYSKINYRAAEINYCYVKLPKTLLKTFFFIDLLFSNTIFNNVTWA